MKFVQENVCLTISLTPFASHVDNISSSIFFIMIMAVALFTAYHDTGSVTCLRMYSKRSSHIRRLKLRSFH